MIGLLLAAVGSAAMAWHGPPEELPPGGALLRLGELEVGGFAQLQYERHGEARAEGTMPGVDVSRQDFVLPRARVSLRWQPLPELRLVAEGEGHGDGAIARDVTASFIEPWTGTGQTLTVGHLLVPFGYEGPIIPEQDLELGTLTRATSTLLPGRRDHGVMLSGQVGLFEHALAVVSGDPSSPDAAPRRIAPDVVGRLGVRTRLGGFGVSGSVGKDVGADVSGVTVTRDEWRVGADGQLALRVPLVGVLTVRGEWIEAQGLARSRGFYAMAVQRILRRVGLVARLDRFDPDLGVNADAVTTLGLGVLVEPMSRLRALVQYDRVADQLGMRTAADGSMTTADRPNDVLMVRLQATF